MQASRVRYALFAPCLLVCGLWADDNLPNRDDIATLLAQPVLPAGRSLEEIREFARPRVPVMSAFGSIDEWTARAEQIRRDMLERVVFRGDAKKWRSAPTQVAWLDSIEGGPGYTIRRLRYEALPGMWLPALVYLPTSLEGRVPVVLNVNGHETKLGKAIAYKQIRCINLAKRGMIAFNPEWLGMGQLNHADNSHYRAKQLDLCGYSGLAPFYLALEKGLDVALSLENADPKRVAVAGLSGGGWQTVFLSSLDERVTLANPVAGYSSLLTRIDVPADLGDPEQMPTEMATVADYCHLTALIAPRPTLLTYNEFDQCCFAADDVLPKLLQAAEPVYQLFGKRSSLRTHVNYIPGDHNFGLDNRLQLYRFLRDHFFSGEVSVPLEEISSEGELKTADELEIPLPRENLTFNSLAKRLAADLPKLPALPTSRAAVAAWQTARRAQLAELVRWSRGQIEAKPVGHARTDVAHSIRWQLKFGSTWTIPATELGGGSAESTVLLMADQGRKTTAAQVATLLSMGHRVIALDPLFIGESVPGEKAPLLSLLLSCVGSRPLGVQASQVGGIARWARKDADHPVYIHANGPRTSLVALVAAALEPTAIAGLSLKQSLGSLKDTIEQNLSVTQAPELFCFGLLEHFDIKQLTALVAPRKVKFDSPSNRVRRDLAGLAKFYGLNGVDFDPVR